MIREWREKRNMKMETTSKWLAFVLVALVFVALMPMAVKPAAAANPNNTQWIPDQPVSAEDGRQSSITTDSYSNLYVAYVEYNEISTNTEIKVAKSTDGGSTWGVIRTISSTSRDLWRPSIAVDLYYNYIYVVYEAKLTSTDRDIWLERFTGVWWYHATIDSAGDNHNPSITIEYEHLPPSNNYVYVVYEKWTSITDKDLMFAKSGDHGALWTVSTLRDTTDLVIEPTITYAATPPHGWIYIAYRHLTLGVPGHIDLFLSGDQGSTWSSRYSIDSRPSSSHDCRNPSVAATHGSNIVAVAYEMSLYPSGDDDIYVNYSTDYGSTWDSIATMIAGSTPWDEKYPHLTVDGMDRFTNYVGYIHATYIKVETVGSRINGIYYSKAHIATRYLWSYPVQVADDNARVTTSYPTYVDRTITTVHDSVPVVVWTDSRETVYKIYATTIGGKYTIDTKPSNLKVRVDGTYYTAPASFYWQLGSSHSLFALSPQGPHSFISWSDGGAQSHTHVASTTAEELIMAYYTPTLTLSISPSTVARGSPITYSGQLTPGVATTISLYYRWSGTYTWHFGVIMSTDATGAYSSTFTVPMSAPTGTLYIVVAWYDSANNRYAVSESKQQVITP